MYKFLRLILFSLAVFIIACKKDNEIEVINNNTIFIYMPYSGPTSPLNIYLTQNLDDMEVYISKNNIKGNNIIYFYQPTPSEAQMVMFEKKCDKVHRKVLKKYTNPNVTTLTGLKEVLLDMKSFAPAKTYAMLLGCHGMGWLPASDIKARTISSTITEDSPVTSYPNYKLTRYFGGSENFKTDFSTLATALKQTNIYLEYILFDDCYATSCEVAMDLKDVTKYLLGCPCEIMAKGLPYQKILGYMLNKPRLNAICDTFYKDYSESSEPYGAMSVLDCSQIDKVAKVMKEINSQYTFDVSKINNIQKFDGFKKGPIFFDLQDYVNNFCPNIELKNKLQTALDSLVVYKVNLPKFYSVFSYPYTHTIRTWCGVTVSDPTTNPDYGASMFKYNTLWWKATHN